MGCGCILQFGLREHYLCQVAELLDWRGLGTVLVRERLWNLQAMSLAFRSGGLLLELGWRLSQKLFHDLRR